MNGHMKRREFLKYFSFGVVGPAFTNFLGLKRKSVQYLIPYVVPPVGVVPGIANWYASVCRQCPAGCGIQVKIREGRAKKIEGNPLHPVNQGRLCARGQAGLQILYNPDRITAPLVRKDDKFSKVSWEKAKKILAEELKAAKDEGRGDRIYFLTEPKRGSLAKLIKTFAAGLGSENIYTYEFLMDESLIKANELCFAYPEIPDYDLGHASYVLSLGAHFLDNWTSPVKQSIAYEQLRDRELGNKGERGWLVHFEPRMSLTGANADEWFPIKPGSEGLIALGIAHIIVNESLQNPEVGEIESWKSVLAEYKPEVVAERSGVSKKMLAAVARDFAAAAAPVALCGGSATAQQGGVLNAVATNTLNYLVGSVGRDGGVKFPAAPPLADNIEPITTHRQIQDLLNKMDGGEVDVLLLDGVNPIYSLPESYGVKEKIAKVPLVVNFSSFMDETAMVANLILPQPTYLESWGDYIPLTDDGRRSIGLMQPAVESMYGIPQFGDLLLAAAALMGDSVAVVLPYTDFYSYLRDSWKAVYNEALAGGQASADFETFWNQCLVQGGWWDSQPRHVQPSNFPTPALLSDLTKNQVKIVEEKDFDFHLWPYPSTALYDGRGANQPWLQQLPEPLVTATWGSWAEINPETAKELNVNEGDILEIKSPEGKLSLPAYIYQAIEPKTIAVPMGQGHRAYGRYAKDRGANPLKILQPLTDKESGALAWASTKIKVFRGDGREAVIKTEPSEDLPGLENGVRELNREIVQWLDPAEEDELRGKSLKPIKALPTRELKEGPHLLTGLGLEKYRHSQFYEYEYRWGMVIDLDKCTGCSACMAACYAENNLPLVDAAQMELHRHKNWIRLDRYWEGEYPNIRAKAIPVNCYHCGNAPCEPVCPVYASYHTKDGLNGQVYQRCVGTRYCNANCPYRARLFNWLNPEWPEPLAEQLNPDLSVRTSGITDKCTFCVQRIRAAKDTAKDENRRVEDGEIQPACAQTCPTGAIVFGDLLNPDSRVSILTRNPRRYRVLEEMNTEPAVVYLKAIRRGAEDERA